MAIKKIAVLASGGNAPGMNNAIISIVRKAKLYDWEVELIYNGYEGLVNKNFHKADLKNLEYFNANGNVIIGSSRFPEFAKEQVRKIAYRNLKERKINALFVIGGNGSFAGGYLLSKLGVKVICIPGSIDNDVQDTETTVGYSTALNTIVRGIDDIRACFDSHSGVCLVEVMGRRYPDLAVNAAIATDAEAVVTGDNILTSKQMAEIANKTFANGHRSCIIVVTEKIYGVDNQPTLKQLQDELTKMLKGRMVRYDVLGYVQRGAVPTAEDRVLANKMASIGLDYLKNAKKNDPSVCILVQKGKIVVQDIKKSVDQKPKVYDNTDLFEYEKYNKF